MSTTDNNNNNKNNESDLYYRVKKLGPLQLVADLASAFATGIAVSVPVTMIDTSIIESLKPGCPTTATSLAVEKLKWGFSNWFRIWQLKGYGVMCVVYVNTYVVANLTQTYYDSRQQDAGITKAIATGCANIPLTAWKDARYAPIFGIAQAKGFPMLTLVLFLVRDFLTMVFSFTLPKRLTTYLNDRFPGTFSLNQMYVLTTLGCPMSVQLFSSFLHIYAFDYYNRPPPQTPMLHASRWETITSKYTQAAGQRCARILTAYGAGNLLNSRIRTNLQKRVEAWEGAAAV
eukprot:PhM_4_TR5762/c1_g1_i1/m.72462